VREALLKRCNLREPSEELLQLLSCTARDDIEGTRLARLGDAALAVAGVHDVFDLLAKFRSARSPIVEFVQALAPLQPRLYSIASSPRCHPGEVHLTVAVVRYELHARGYQGVASCFFADRARRGARGTSSGARFARDAAAPIIMIGHGHPPSRFSGARRAGALARAGSSSATRGASSTYRGELEGHLMKAAF
jgi:sulfite reductase (NADPH) flavoprotein alpha-component